MSVKIASRVKYSKVSVVSAINVKAAIETSAN